MGRVVQSEEALLPNCEQDEAVQESIWEVFTRLFADVGEKFGPITHFFGPRPNTSQHKSYHYTAHFDPGAVETPKPIIVAGHWCRYAWLDEYQTFCDDEPLPNVNKGYLRATDTDRQRRHATQAVSSACGLVDRWLRLLLHTIWPRAPPP